jgi:hypothetical protein
MKYLLALVMLIASPVWSEEIPAWKFIAGTDDFTMVFVDFETIRREGSVVKVWELINHTKPRILEGREIFSTRSKVEYDCKQEKSRVLTMTWFSNYYARTPIKTFEEVGNWQYIPPKTLFWEVLQSVCKAPAR